VFTKINLIVSFLCLANYFLQVTTHLLTSFCNPGIPKKEYVCPLEVGSNGKLDITKTSKYPNYKFCPQCNILVPNNKQVNHCDECNICIEGKF